MKVYNNPILKCQPTDLFINLVENSDIILANLKEQIEPKLRENSKLEAESKMYAAKFFTTV